MSGGFEPGLTDSLSIKYIVLKKNHICGYLNAKYLPEDYEFLEETMIWFNEYLMQIDNSRIRFFNDKNWTNKYGNYFPIKNFEKIKLLYANKEDETLFMNENAIEDVNIVRRKINKIMNDNNTLCFELVTPIDIPTNMLLVRFIRKLMDHDNIDIFRYYPDIKTIFAINKNTF